MTPTLFAFAKLDGAALGEDDLMAFPRHGSMSEMEIFHQSSVTIEI